VITNLYGSVTSSAVTLTVVPTASGVVFSNLHTFSSYYVSPPDGASPYAALMLDTNGNLYGTTYGGGSNGYGTIFRMTPGGDLATLYSFGSVLSTNYEPLDGSYPYAPLLAASDGNLYGTTFAGGSHIIQYGDGFGTLFRITTNGTLTTLYSFGSILDTNGDALDGASPEGGLVQGGDGYLYGTTSSGGENDFGTVFQVNTNGSLLTLYRFTGGDDGATPLAGLVLLGNTLYGTASSAGSNYYGTVFSISLGSVSLPELSIVRSGTNVILTWPTSAAGFNLQSTTNLALPGLWAPAGPAPAVINGLNTVTNAISGRAEYYRLAQ
jgi:uncharacterized repeat protein (TIGR03803 family)